MTAPTPSPPPAKEHATIALEAWKKVVQTQEHFNEICMKVRTLYATVLAAIISLYGVFLKDTTNHGFEIGEIHFDPITAVCVAIIVATTLFYFVDKEWYHRLLLGSVDQGIAIEKRWEDILPEIQLGSKISARSPVDFSDTPKLAWFLKLFVRDERFRKQNLLHSDAKVEVFYKPIRGLAIGILAAAALFGGIEYQSRSLVGWAWHGITSLCSS